MKLYVIGAFVQFTDFVTKRLMSECDVCMMAERAPRVGQLYTVEGSSVVVTKVEHFGKVITVQATESN